MSLDYQIVSGDKGRVLNIDVRNEVVNVMLPAPVLGFVITVKDLYGNSANNPITIIRDGSENIDNFPDDLIINVNFDSVTLISDGTNWFRMSNFTGLSMTQGVGLWGGGELGSNPGVNTIDYVSINLLSMAADFGDLTQARYYTASCSSSLRGVWGGGFTGVGQGVDTMDYVNFASNSNAASFGVLSALRRGAAGCGNNILGVFSGGVNSGGGDSAIMDYINFATLSNAISFGNLSVGRSYPGSTSNSVRGLIVGGSGSNVIDYITLSTTSNATDFGDLTAQRRWAACAASLTRAVFFSGDESSGGGGVHIVKIEYVEIATLGNSASFGNLNNSRGGAGATSSKVRAVVGGGYQGANFLSNMEYVTTATLSNASNFGSLTQGRDLLSACSNVHGGL